MEVRRELKTTEFLVHRCGVFFTFNFVSIHLSIRKETRATWMPEYVVGGPMPSAKENLRLYGEFLADILINRYSPMRLDQQLICRSPDGFTIRS
jgi:hypothetical protein